MDRKNTIRYVPLKNLEDKELARAFGYTEENPRHSYAGMAGFEEAANKTDLTRYGQSAVKKGGAHAKKKDKKNEKKRSAGATIGRFLRDTLLLFVALFMLAGATFYLLVGVGLSPRLQTLWVTTAMTTKDHKWLATAIVPEKKIREIMNRETISDVGYDTNLEDKNGYIGWQMDEMEKEINYTNAGYEKLEDGLYLKEVTGSGWHGFIMLVPDPKDLRLVDTPQQGVKGASVRWMVENEGGIAGVNGGGFDDGPNYDSNGGVVSGLLIIDGKLINPSWDDSGLKYNMIGFNSDGRLILRHCTKEWALANDIRYAVSFSPFLIVNGEGTIPEGSSGGWGIAPRTAIGQRSTGEVLLLVIDGRQPTWSIGVDLDVLQKVLLEEGCENAAMMDGGSSTVMIYNNEFVNRPSLGHERFINNCWVVMPHTEKPLWSY